VAQARRLLEYFNKGDERAFRSDIGHDLYLKGATMDNDMGRWGNRFFADNIFFSTVRKQ
jgi:hypothetical protein